MKNEATKKATIPVLNMMIEHATRDRQVFGQATRRDLAIPRFSRSLKRTERGKARSEGALLMPVEYGCSIWKRSGQCS